MADPISSLGRTTQADLAAENRLKKIEDDKRNAAQSGQSPRAAEPAEDRVELSGIDARAMAAPDFDSEKVERIKQAIRDGNYPLDARRIAESFVSLERMISGAADR
ncbi:MAG: flagellar biosynthesis anti-sigma factor FlgM [Proteobacteria bacterium]|nr:flagellar biosynthesis anti-sigma factor FlgM [Pseudomonadota bacterium]